MKTKIIGFVIFLFIQHNILAQVTASDNYISQTGTLGTTYSWIDCSGGTSVFESGDDNQKIIAWPFNFRFYDNNYTTSNSFSIATNGFIRLDGNASTNYTTAQNYNLTSTATQLGQIIAIAVHDGNTNDNGSWIRYLVTGSSPNRILTIEYNNLEIDYNDNRYADTQVSIYESTNRIVLKLGADNLRKDGADIGLHSGVNTFFHKWQEVRSGTNNTWIEYTPPNVEVNATIGNSLAYYATVKEAYDKINDGIHQGEINIKIHNNTTETASAILNSNGTGSANYASINMYPTKTGLSITGNIPAPLIDLNGANNVTINGSLNENGVSKELNLINTSTASYGGNSTIRFINGATNNTIKYCTIKGSESRTDYGVIFFSSSNSGSGNSNNIIDNNDITNAGDRPVNAIYSVGTTGKTNSENVISNNNIYDFFKHATASRGISLNANTTTWTIDGNSFYETTAFTPTGTVTLEPIRIDNTGGNEFIISNNYIGGTAPQCGGTAWTKTNNNNNLFNAIYLNVGNSVASSVQNNTIRNINWSNSGIAEWVGININNGSVNLGTITGNIIGSTTDTNSINVTGGSNGQKIKGIRMNGTGVINCFNNNIGSITGLTSTNFATNIYGIEVIGTSIVTIENNTIGSSTTENSIYASSASLSNQQLIYGIYARDHAEVLNIQENIISNLTNNTSNSAVSTQGVINGIYANKGTNIIKGNSISNLSIANANNSSSSPSISGIYINIDTDLPQTINKNTINNLSNTSPSFTGLLSGIYFKRTNGTSSNTVDSNFIHSLSVPETSIGSEITGIYEFADNTTFSNNIITLDGGTSTEITGVFDGGDSGYSVNFFFNSIYISGTNSGSEKSYCIRYNTANNTRDLRNNILFNARAGGTGGHYALYYDNTVGTFTSDYNDYFVSGTGGVLAYYNGDKTTLGDLQTATSQDTSSLNTNPNFASAGNINSEDYITSAAMSGITGTGIITDYDEITRNNPPKMGALEFSLGFVWQGNTDSDFGTATNWENGVVPPNGADISFATNPANDCILDINHTLKSITNSQSSKKLIVNGNQLIITGDLIFSNGAQINASATTSEVIFGGLTAQNIPNGAFVSNIINSLTSNNNHGVSQNGDIIIQDQFTLTNGNYNIQANVLTINGDISTTSGTLVGGNTSNLVFGGNGTSTTLPNTTLNNLTVNRLNGISLGGNLNIEGTLALTSGTLILGSNAITITNNSPIRTNGNIDASDETAIVNFLNPIGITLPTSLFLGEINNLTINGGGITINNNITINGILDLQTANPSAIKGLLDISDPFELKMGETATTIGTGDLTGIIKRQHTFTGNIPYTFGNQYTSITFVNVTGGVKPAWISCKIAIGTSPSWRSEAINRVYSFAQDGTGTDRTITNLHYLDSELYNTETDENKLVFWDAYTGPTFTNKFPRSKSNSDGTNNWVGLTGMAINFIATSNTLDVKQWGLSYTNVPVITWTGNGSPTYAGDWSLPGNWNGGVPTSTDNVLIPAILPSDTNGYPTQNIFIPRVPAVAKTIEIELGASLTVDDFDITIYGDVAAWNNAGNFVPGSGTVFFANGDLNNTVSINGNTNFNNLTINDNTYMQPATGSTIGIAGTLTTGTGSILDFIATNNTIEYNGINQTIINPIGTGTDKGYHNLILSGSGIKTMPNTALSIKGKFELEEGATATADSQLTIGDELEIISGATFNTGPFNHSVAGNFDVGGHVDTGTFNPEPGYSITLNGTTIQSIYGDNTISFEKLIIDNSIGIEMYTDVTVNDELTLTNGSLNLEETTLILGGGLTKTSGFLNTIEQSSLAFTNGITSTALNLPATLFETPPTVKDFTVNKTGGITINSDIKINGVLSMLNANPSTTKGNIDTGSFTIHMGESATTIGIGDVSGIIKRTTFLPGIEYTFGHQFTSVKFTNVGVLPTEISLKIGLGTAPTWKTDGVKRIYDIIQVGGDETRGLIKSHYLDSELNGVTENTLGYFSYIDIPPTPSYTIDRGLTEINTTENWISIGNANFGNFPPVFGLVEGSFGETISDIITWDGSESSDWFNADNWLPANVPAPHITVIIPDTTTTPIDPIILAGSSTSINKIDIQDGGILTAENNSSLEVKGTGGAWINYGTFNGNTGSRVFFNSEKPTEITTVAGVTNFYNVEVGANSSIQPLSGAIVRIEGTGIVDATSITDFSNTDNTVEWNGVDQDIVNPIGISGFEGYYNLILSGSGIKTIAPSISVTRIAGDFSVSGTPTAIAMDSLKIKQNMTIGVGAIFQTGVHHHELAGDFENNGTFIGTSGGTIIFNGEESQTISGTSIISFDNLTLDKTLNNVTLSSSIDVNNKLLLNGGNLIIENNTLAINGTISNPSGAIEVNTTSNLSFGGVSEITINNNLFNTTPSINNLVINRSGGVTLGNQNMIVNGVLDLPFGTLTLADKTLNLAGSSPTLTLGNIDASSLNSEMLFTNTAALTLPSSIFSGDIVTNLTVNGTGGVIANDDITLTGVLKLDSSNPSATIGSLSMESSSIIDMGVDATTIGIGDVTGIVKREHVFTDGVEYSFGNQFTTMNFLDVPGGIKPKWMKCKITIGTAPTWRNEAINRYYSFSQFQGDETTPKGTDRMIFKLHYLDSELHDTELDESQLVYWDAYHPDFEANNFTQYYPRNKNGNNVNDNWVQLNGPSINYISTSDQLDVKQWGLSYSNVTIHSWTGNGSPSFDGDWSLPGNWNGGVPQSNNDVIIPHPSSLPADNNGDLNPYVNLLPIIAPSEIRSLEIVSGAQVSATDYDITVYGDENAWVNNGIFLPGTANVIFANGDYDDVDNNVVQIKGTTNFYDLTVKDKTLIQPANESVISIENEINFTESSILDFDTTNTTINYNGGIQTVITPNGGTQGYYNLSLSGNDVKTLPSSTLELIGNLSIYESAIVTAENNITVGANLNISDTSKLTIDPSIELTVNGTVSNLVGTAGLILSSSNIGTASLSHNTDNVPATVERYISGAAEDWHFLSSSVSNQTIEGSNWLPNGTYGNGTGYDLYIWDEPTPCWIYQLNTTNAPNWPTKHPSNEFVPGRGYLYSVQ